MAFSKKKKTKKTPKPMDVDTTPPAGIPAPPPEFAVPEPPELPPVESGNVWDHKDFEAKVKSNMLINDIHDMLMDAPKYKSMPPEYRLEAYIAFIRTRFGFGMPLPGITSDKGVKSW